MFLPLTAHHWRNRKACEMNSTRLTSTLVGRILLSAWLLVLLSDGRSANHDATTGSTATLTPQQRKKNLESFDYVWKTIRDKHYDPKLGGLDWQAAHDELRPQMEQADTPDKSRKILTQMIHRLGESHFTIVPE